MKLREVSIGLSLDTKSLDKGATSAAKFFDDLDKKAKKTDKVLEAIGVTAKKTGSDLEEAGKKGKETGDSWARSFRQTIGTINALRSAFGTAAASFREVFTAASEGARNQAATKFFEQSGKSIGDLRKATAGMISDAELMKKANLADSMGINTTTFKVLAQVAQASALKTGQSFDHMFNSIIVGTARSSRLLLDNLGIIVSVDQANENYAKNQLKQQGVQNATNKQINDFVKGMDDAAKKVAFAEEVQAQAAKTLTEFSNLGGAAAANYDKFSAAISNLKDALKEMLSDSIVPLLPKLTELISKLSVIARFGGLVDGKGGGVAGALLGTVGEALIPGMDVGGSMNLAASRAQTNQQAKRNDALLAVEDQKAFIEQILRPGESLESVVQTFRKFNTTMDPVLDKAVAIFEKLSREAGSPLEVVPLNAGPSKPGKDKGKRPKSWVELELDIEEEQFKKLKEWREKNIKDAAKLDLENILSGQKAELETAKEAARAEKEAQDWIDSLENAGNGLDDLRRESKRLAEATDLANKSLDAFAVELNADRDRGIGQAIGGIASGSGIAGPILGGIETAMSALGGIGGALTTALLPAIGAGAGPVGAIISAVLPVIANIIDGLKPVQDILAAIGQGLGLLFKNMLGPLLTALVPLFTALVPVLAAMGIALGGLLDPLADLLVNVAVGIGYFLSLYIVVFTIVGLFYNLITGVLNLLDIFGWFGASATEGVEGLKLFTRMMIETAVKINNGFVSIMRRIPGMKNWGRKLSAEDFLGDEDEATKDNTDATDANTAAVRDLTREFRNLPQNYKGEEAVFRSQNPRTAQTIGQTILDGLNRNVQRVRI